MKIIKTIDELENDIVIDDSYNSKLTCISFDIGITPIEFERIKTTGYNNAFKNKKENCGITDTYFMSTKNIKVYISQEDEITAYFLDIHEDRDLILLGRNDSNDFDNGLAFVLNDFKRFFEYLYTI